WRWREIRRNTRYPPRQQSAKAHRAGDLLVDGSRVCRASGFAHGAQGQTVASDAERQNLPATLAKTFAEAVLGAFLHQKNDAASAAGSAHLRRPTAVLSGRGDEFVNERSGNPGSVGASQFPLLPQQAGDAVPVAASECGVHFTGDTRNLVEITVHVPVAVNMRFKDFPVVDSRLPRCA